MNFTSLDANVVLRLILEDVPDQSRRARRVIDKSKCYVTDVVTNEVVYVLERVHRFERILIVRLMTTFFALETVHHNEELITAAFRLYLKSPSLSLADCYSAVESHSFGHDLLTFDKALIRHGGGHVKEPK
ncbi:MAG: PIN domain-containing protein [Acidobacteria bacterium]|nr:PIN domain-containing protein [Acidobacteriota bacterium]